MYVHALEMHRLVGYLGGSNQNAVKDDASAAEVHWVSNRGNMVLLVVTAADSYAAPVCRCSGMGTT